MHIEIQVALNFVISYLYNKLPRRRVNIFGEELEKALRNKFQGHWYPEKPFKGSAFRCLKTGDPIDPVLERAAHESGVPIADILENLPNELSVWVDPGEVSYRIGEKGQVKILYSENSDNHEDNTSADREVNKTFNPEAQCFRPIDAINTSMNSLSLSPKTSPPHSGSSPHSASSTSPTYKGSPNTAATAGAASFLQRQQAPLTFTTATFAQTKFGSTKLKTNSKRANSSYRMSPTEFSNYIKQRAMQQQLHHGHGPAGPQSNHFGPIGPISPARSLSPNPLSMGLGQNADPFYFPNMPMGMYPHYNGHRNMFDGQFHPDANAGLYGANGGSAAGHNNKFNAYLEPHGFYGIGNHLQQQQQQQQQHQHHMMPSPQLQQQQQKNLINIDKDNNNTNTNISVSVTNGSAAESMSTPVPSAPSSLSSQSSLQSQSSSQQQQAASPAAAASTNATTTSSASASMNAPIAVSPIPTIASAAAAAASSNANSASAAAAAAALAAAANNQDSNSSKLMDGLNSFYSNATGPFQQLLVAN